MKDIVSKVAYDYNIYSVIGFILSLIYFVALVFGITVNETSLSKEAADTINAVYWVLVYFGTPVMLLLSFFGYFSASGMKKRGKIFAAGAFLSPLLLIVVVYNWWPSVFL